MTMTTNFGRGKRQYMVSKTNFTHLLSITAPEQNGHNNNRVPRWGCKNINCWYVSDRRASTSNAVTSIPQHFEVLQT